MKITRLSSILALLALAGAAAAQPQFITLQGVPDDISGDGNVVVGSNGGIFRWTRSGTSSTYTVLNPNTAGGGTAGVSSDGSVVTGSMINTSDLFGVVGNVLAGRWTAGTGFQEANDYLVFFTASGNSHNVPRACTRDGRYIVGFGYVSGGIGGYRGMLHDTQTGTARIIPGIAASAARIICVSDDASVVAGDDDITGSAQRPAIWRLDTMTNTYVGQILEPGTGGAGSSSVQAISADGTKATGRSYFDANKLVRFEYDSGTGQYVKVIKATALANSATVLTSVNAMCMTPDGETIFGQYNNNRSFIWTAADGMRDLTIDLTAEGMTGTVANYVVTSVNSCSNDGRAFTVPGGLGIARGVIFRDGAGGCVAPAIAPAPSTAQVSACTTTIIINASATGSGPFTYQFFKNGNPVVAGPTGNVNANGVASNFVINASNPSALQVQTAGPADAGDYHVIVSNACSSAQTPTHTVTALAPVANDTCETAMEVAGTGDIFLPMCGAYLNQSLATCAPVAQLADVWVRYTPTFTGDLRVTTCLGSNFNTILSVKSECGGPDLVCNDDFCGSASSIERMAVVDAQPILIRLGARSAVPGSDVRLTFEQLPPPPANDLCANATPITADGGYTVDTTFAGNDGSASCVTAGGSGLGKDVWYSFVNTRPGNLTLSTCGMTANTVLSVYSGCGATQIACNDNANVTGCTFQSTISNLALARNQAVVIRVAGNSLPLVVTGILNATFVATGAPCNLDFNGDGFIGTPDDLDDFITAFFSDIDGERGRCDFNEDGIVEPGDLDGFITAYFEGC
ncbi:MAG: hypothetical protein ACT4PL_01645 [Phycisphaerales bacterium]